MGFFLFISSFCCFSAPTENIMMENETKNTILENVEPTDNNLDYKPYTSVPNTEPEAKTGPGAKTGPEAEPRAEPQVTGTNPYASSKPPITEKDFRLDKRTSKLYNKETMKYRDSERGGDSDEDYIPEPELEQTEPDEPEEEQDNGDTEKGEEPDYQALLKKYDVSENPDENLK